MRKMIDFVCPECGATEEHFVHDDEKVYCHYNKHPESVEMQRLPSAPGMVKGNFADKPRIR